MKLSERIYLRGTDFLPQAMAARLDLMRPSYFASWGGPFNGQERRQALVREIMSAFPFDEVVETGTYRATTTEFLAHVSGLDVYSVEFLARYHKFAAARCAPLHRVHLVRADSRAFLREFAETHAGSSTFFYLDAHWMADVPRYEEVEIISEYWKRAVIMIDDFQVGDDPGYSFTQYGGAPLNLKYLPHMPRWGKYYPSAHSSSESGERRGTVVLVSPELRQHATSVGSIRPVHDERGAGTD